MSDPTWGDQSESGGQRPPKVDESSGDDWNWDDVESFEDHRPRGSESGSSEARAGGEPRTGLITAANDGGSQPSPFAARSAVIRRRRIAAFSVLVLLVILAVVVPLVVFGGGGGSVAEQTTPLTTAERTTTAPRTTTRPPTTTASTVTTPIRRSCESHFLKARLCAGETPRQQSRISRGDWRHSGSRRVPQTASSVRPPRLPVVDFQQSNNLPPDGIVGIDTVHAF